MASLDSAVRAAPSRQWGGFLSTSIFSKSVMALSGFVWVGFLVGHLGTNLHLFGGPVSLNDYYAGLKANTFVFWGVRVVLATSVLAHIAAAVTLMRRNADARPVAYRRRSSLATSFASRTMRWSGPLLGLFILYHLLHLTVGSAMPSGTTFTEGDDFGNIVSSFSVWYVAAIYIASIGLLSLYDRPARIAAIGIASLISLGMLSIPVAVVMGFVQ